MEKVELEKDIKSEGLETVEKKATGKTKKDIVKMLVKNKELEGKDEEQLIEMLFNEPIAIDVDKESEEKETWSDRLADKITEVAGSWSFIVSFIVVIIAWMALNVYMMYQKNDAFDPYPFILLNLVLSCIAALQAPVIMMSQNRAAKKDTLRGKNDYKTDLKSELILEELHDQMKKIVSNQNKILKLIDNINTEEEGKE